MNQEQRIDFAIDSGIDIFWTYLRNQFPEATSGDLTPSTAYDLETWVRKAVEEWVEMNVPKPEYYVQRTLVQVIKIVDATSSEDAEGIAADFTDAEYRIDAIDTSIEYIVLDASGKAL